MAKVSEQSPAAAPAEKSRARSPELTGGEGFTYEDSVVALFLAALAREEAAIGSAGPVVRVAVQQASQGEPMDDLVVDSALNGERYRQSFQVKRSLPVSKNDPDFQEIVRQSWATRAQGHFVQGRHRYGFITRKVGNDRFESLKRNIAKAESSTGGAEFDLRFKTGGEASAADIALRGELLEMLVNPSPDDELAFYQGLVAHRIDGLEPGGDRYTDLSNRLGEIAADGPSIGPVLARALCRHVREGEGTARVWTRGSLLNVLRALARLKAVPAYAADVAVLEDVARAAVAEIRTDIGGVEIARTDLLAKAEVVARDHRFSDIRGLPGTGKSVLLRRVVEAAIARGPVLFLKSDKLDGNSWRAFANSLRLEHLEPTPLLVEIGATGTPTLFIDGIDRIRPDQRGIVTDLVRVLETDPALKHWTILATSRDQGLEVLRSWIPLSLHGEMGAGNVCVEELSDDEAGALADAIPALRPLLFGDPAVQKIARRPFFAAVLAKRAASGAPPGSPQSETELIKGWWEAGGYDVPAADAVKRQRHILTLEESGE